MPGRSVTATMLATTALVAVVDQATKATIFEAIGPGQPAGRVDLIGSWLSLEYAENRGVAFGLLSGVGGLVPLASLLVLVVLVTRFLRSPVTPLEAFAIGAILGGALGNLIDRFRLGYVVDFIVVGAWPNFNIADSAITIGVGLLIWNWLAPGTERDAVWT